MPCRLPFIKMTIITLAACVPQRTAGRTNERSVRGFELSRTKLLWLHKVQSGVLRPGFSWRLPPALEFFAHRWLLVLLSSLHTVGCSSGHGQRALLEKCQAAAAFTQGQGGIFIGVIVSETFVPVAHFLVHVRLFCRRESTGKWHEPMWEASAPTFPNDSPTRESLSQSQLGRRQNVVYYCKRNVSPAKRQCYIL